MPELSTLPSPHELIRRIEAEARPGGAWTYDADPTWANCAAIVFPERILLRITADAAGYAWQVEQWDLGDDTYQAIPGQRGTAATPTEMAEVAVRFIDEHNVGEPVPVTVYPLAEELGERILAGYPRAHWRSYVNDVYAFVLEYPNEQRLAFWDEADFMGSIAGYTWTREQYDPAEDRWVSVAASSDMVSIGQLRGTIAQFHDTAETRYRAVGAPAVTRNLFVRADRPASEELARRLAERAAALGHDGPTDAGVTRPAPRIAPSR